MPGHIRNATTVRGRLSVAQEEDALRRRTVLVARFTPAKGNGTLMQRLPPLYDVQLISLNGEVMTLAGYERVVAGVLQQDYVLGQSWIVTPGPIEDLMHAEAQWRDAAEKIVELQAQLQTGEAARTGSRVEPLG